MSTRPFNSKLSLAIDRAVIALENPRITGLRRIAWRVYFWWLTRGIP